MWLNELVGLTHQERCINFRYIAFLVYHPPHVLNNFQVLECYCFSKRKQFVKPRVLRTSHGRYNNTLFVLLYCRVYVLFYYTLRNSVACTALLVKYVNELLQYRNPVRFTTSTRTVPTYLTIHYTYM